MLLLRVSIIEMNTIEHSVASDTNPSAGLGGVRQDASITTLDVEKGARAPEKAESLGQTRAAPIPCYKLTNDQKADDEASDDLPPLKALSLLDRFLVVWIILAMAIGIILGNTVHSAGSRLQEGTFVGVSIPIGV